MKCIGGGVDVNYLGVVVFVLPCIFLRFFFNNQPEMGSCCVSSENDNLEFNKLASANATEKLSILGVFRENVLSIKINKTKQKKVS